MTRETLAMTCEDSYSRLMTQDSAPAKSNDSRIDSHYSCTALPVFVHRPCDSPVASVPELVNARPITAHLFGHVLSEDRNHADMRDHDGHALTVALQGEQLELYEAAT